MSKNMYLPKSQAQTLEYLMEQEWFTDEEMDILKQGRNAKSHTKAKILMFKHIVKVQR